MLLHVSVCLPEDDADASKHVGVFTIHKILLMYIYVVHLLVWIINYGYSVACPLSHPLLLNYPYR